MVAVASTAVSACQTLLAVSCFASSYMWRWRWRIGGGVVDVGGASIRRRFGERLRWWRRRWKVGVRRAKERHGDWPRQIQQELKERLVVDGERALRTAAPS